MARTFIRQDTQIYSSDAYTDNTAPTEANYETNSLHLETDLNNLRSLSHHIVALQGGNWYDAITTPSTLEAGSQRGINALNDALHILEKKRILTCVFNLHSIAGGAGQHVILGGAELPSNTTAAVGAVTTLGTVAAQATVFGTASVADIVAGTTAIAPRNLISLVNAVTRDPILDAGDKIYGLLQTEDGVDGHTMTGVATDRVQISFVKISGGTTLSLITAGAMNTNFDFCHNERVRLEDLSEDNFLGGASVDVPAGTTVTRQAGYDNQGATPVDLTNNAVLDLEAAGVSWILRDNLEQVLLRMLEGSAGGTTEFQLGADVDVFNNDALVNDFAAGMSVRSGSLQINIGVTDGTIESDAAEDLRILGAAELFLDDGNQTGSTWAQTNGIKLSETTAEWDAFETEFGGEVSILNAIVAASNAAARTKGQAVVTANAAADTDVANTTAANLDVDLPDYSGVTSFVNDVDVYLNGVLLRNGANAAANEDVYPGTNTTVGMLRFEFGLKGTGSKPDVLTMVVNGA